VIEKTKKTPTVVPCFFGAERERMGQVDARDSRAAAFGLGCSGEALEQAALPSSHPARSEKVSG
jgi:hypothetical protein